MLHSRSPLAISIKRRNSRIRPRGDPAHVFLSSGWGSKWTTTTQTKTRTNSISSRLWPLQSAHLPPQRPPRITIDLAPRALKTVASHATARQQISIVLGKRVPARTCNLQIRPTPKSILAFLKHSILIRTTRTSPPRPLPELHPQQRRPVSHRLLVEH